MLKIFLAMLLAGCAATANAGMDIPLQARENHLTFKDGSELLVRSDGERLVLVRLSYKGVVHELAGAVLDGLTDPDLSSVRAVLVGRNRAGCTSGWCLEYAMPSITMDVGGIPQDQECPWNCRVHFLMDGDQVYRTTFSGTGSDRVHHPRQAYPAHLR